MVLVSDAVAGFYTGIFARGGIRFFAFLNMYSLLSFGFIVEFYLAVVL